MAAPTRTDFVDVYGKVHAGQRYAAKMQPISYTRKTVVGLAAYKKHLLTEFKEKREAQTGPKGGKSPWANFNGFNPYLERYGTAWKQHLPQSFKYICITDIMDHVIKEGNRIFQGSTHEKDWCIYHDRLSSWWEKEEAQDYLASKGFKLRQWCSTSWTDDSITKYYKGMLMGDSPELMPLDSSLFNDLIEAIAKHVTATYHIPLPTKETPQPDKYSMATPALAWETMTELWMSDVIPSARIFYDCDKFERALDAIIEARGCIVEEFNNRNGHRAVAARLGRESFKQKLTPKALEGMREQMRTWEGISGGTGMVFSPVYIA